MKGLVTLFCLISFSTFSQTIYQVNEVEKVAEPAGGLGLFNRFVAANLRIPVHAAAKGLNSRVLIKGVVETDGTMTGLGVARSLDSLCDIEALRVMSLYKAWKPALVKGQPVRQAVVYPVVFRTAPIPSYDSTQSAMIEYFDRNHIMVSDDKKFKFRNVIPVDRYGDVRADILFQEKRGGEWKTVKTFPFQKDEIWVKLTGVIKLDSVQAYRISANMGNWESPSEEIITQADGRLLSFVAYPGSGKLPSVSKSFFRSGMLREEKISADSLTQITSWYENGQLGNVILLDHKNKVSVIENWDMDGTILVKEGSGTARIQAGVYDGEMVYEEGPVVNGLKTGHWIGRHSINNLVYEEDYQDGILMKGVRNPGEQPTEYTIDAIPPKFRGGPNEFVKLLNQHVDIFPTLNPANGIPKGKLLVSFIVHENGKLSDYSLDRGVAKNVDRQIMEMIKKTSGGWDPAVKKGKKVTTRYTLPINFESR
ncbi:energy transducer TonB [Dyadobacter psychrophilus]|uniref:TonB protein C-terminal n=1 Tax=Dyadobacter psychrophilus TaxID=651661 RepID=A0A1T5DZI3_9BACT|nr:energy transducer TonB [Dyadobacter psychrophilus]SKB77147.1 TonB protein C-terminal [Dyadobacter psychrophilus]